MLANKTAIDTLLSLPEEANEYKTGSNEHNLKGP